MAADQHDLPETRLLKEAADWALTLRYDEPSPEARQAFERWRERSPWHALAWSRAQAVFQAFGQVPADVGKETLKGLQPGRSRRRSLRALGGVALAAPAAWLAWRHAPWRQWSADVATATGERRPLQLPDGTQLVLNTASAIDIAFTATQRRIRLVAGEILVTTHPDPAQTPRPFMVDTVCGVVDALGTRFSVRSMSDEDRCRVAVFEHAVEVRPLAGASRLVQAGEQVDFGAGRVDPPVAADSASLLWTEGTLLARRMPLGDVIAELSRHRTGVLRCDPAVAAMPVSGAISLADTDAALDLLAQSLPLRIERRTRYWIVVGPRS